MSLAINTTAAGDIQAIAVVGEVDVSNAAELREAVEQAFAAGAKRLEIDLSQVSYIDSTGIGVLVGAAHSAAEADAGFAVLKPQANVKRILGMLGVEKDLNIEE